VSVDVARQLVTLASRTRALDDASLPEGASTRMLIYAATLIAGGMDAASACRIGVIQPLTDDPDLSAALIAVAAGIVG
jgi:nitric oxide reductase NorQ protein